jgi:hypothetical protein
MSATEDIPQLVARPKRADARQPRTERFDK